jgi:hypothetical protein
MMAERSKHVVDKVQCICTEVVTRKINIITIKSTFYQNQAASVPREIKTRQLGDSERASAWQKTPKEGSLTSLAFCKSSSWSEIRVSSRKSENSERKSNGT